MTQAYRLILVSKESPEGYDLGIGSMKRFFTAPSLLGLDVNGDFVHLNYQIYNHKWKEAIKPQKISNSLIAERVRLISQNSIKDYFTLVTEDNHLIIYSYYYNRILQTIPLNEQVQAITGSIILYVNGRIDIISPDGDNFTLVEIIKLDFKVKDICHHQHELFVIDDNGLLFVYSINDNICNLTDSLKLGENSGLTKFLDNESYAENEDYSILRLKKMNVIDLPCRLMNIEKYETNLRRMKTTKRARMMEY